MWEPSNVAEKKFNAETHKLIGETQLHEFGLFLEKFNEKVTNYEKKFIKVYNVTLQPISIDEQIHKYESILNLVHSDNKILSRILASLGGICKEIRMLIRESELLYPEFIFYGEVMEKTLGHLSVSKIIESLQKVHCFVIRVQQVIIITLQQLSAILGKGFYLSSSTSSFPEVLNNFGDLLICLLKLDSLLETQIFKDHWFLYRRSVRNVSHNHTKYDFERDQLTSFDKTLMLLENDLLMGRILKFFPLTRTFLQKSIFLSTLAINIDKNVNVDPVREEINETASDWFSANYLCLNRGKIQGLEFSLKSRTADVKFLGLSIDTRLNWQNHINSLPKNLSIFIYAVKNIKYKINMGVALISYYTLLHNTMTCGIINWGASCHIQKMFTLQKRAIRTLAGSPHRDSCKPWFTNFDILTLPSAIIYSNLVYVKNNVDKFRTKNMDYHDHLTNSRSNLVIPTHSLTNTNKTYIGLKLFNKLSIPVKEAPLSINQL